MNLFYLFDRKSYFVNYSWFTILQLLIQFSATFGNRIFLNNPFSHIENLHPEFVLEYIANPKKPNALFNITAKTRGYVALGFSKTGSMSRSDYVIGGVGSNGVPYITDRYTIEGRIPVQDVQQDWKLLGATENGTHTKLSFMRAMDTCDPQDFSFNDDTIYLMWAFGENDSIDYHFKNRGSIPVQLFQPSLMPDVSMIFSKTSPPTFNMTGLDLWRLSVDVKNLNASSQGSSWCVFQKGPELPKKHYIIGFSTPTKNEAMKQNLDRMVIYKCTLHNLKNNETENFQKLVDYGDECKNMSALFSYCKNIIYTWGRGGKDTFLPKNAGIPFGIENEFYLFESFLRGKDPSKNTSDSDNVEDKEFSVDTDFLLSDTPKKYEVKIIKVGYNPRSTLIIPPGAPNFEVFGHCASDCTELMISRRKAMRVYAVSFDTGRLGKKVSLHHVRNAHQIPVILVNNNYDPSFQQTQTLQQEIPVRYGDQITVHCTYRNGVRSGQKSAHHSSTSPQRCLAYMWYYYEHNANKTAPTKSPHDCTSTVHPGDLGIWIATNAPSLKKRNLNMQQVSALNDIKWTQQLRMSLHYLYKFGRYRTTCAVENHIVKNNITTGTNGSNSHQQKKGNTPNNRGSITNRANGTNVTLSPTPKAGDLTVFPLPVEELPYKISCPTLGRPPPILLRPPGSVILGFP